MDLAGADPQPFQQLAMPYRELQKVKRDEADLLAWAVTLVERRAPGAQIRAAYARVASLRARKTELMEDLGLVQAGPASGAAFGWLQPPGERSGNGAATALLHLLQDERRRSRLH